ncbi:hypothetical protein MCEORH2_01705 [Methylophilaceae bacterium]
MTSIQEASTASGIPLEELEALLALPYKRGTCLPRPMTLNSLGFARGVISDIRAELDLKLKQGRRDAQAKVDNTFRLIMCNLVSCVFTRERLALPGTNSAYGTNTYYHKLFLTRRSVKAVVGALEGKYIKRKKGNTYKHQVDGYQPTPELELKLITLLYLTYETYNPLEPLVILKAEEETVGEIEEEHIMRIRSSIELETTHSTDDDALRRINAALNDATYALKGPVKRIYSHGDTMQGGRLYVRLQSLPDRRARIRINTLFNGMPIAEVDLSANHPRMLMALEGEQLSENFYDEIAEASATSRDKVKFLVMKMVGAKNRGISLVVKEDEKNWYKSKFKMTEAERRRIESVIEEKYPQLYPWLYKGRGIHMQALEGDILLEAMLTLLDQQILSLPMHDAIYVQQEHIAQAKAALENAWMHALGVSFRPYTKIDMP